MEMIKWINKHMIALKATLFEKIVNSFQVQTILAKSFILDVLVSSEYAPAADTGRLGLALPKVDVKLNRHLSEIYFNLLKMFIQRICFCRQKSFTFDFFLVARFFRVS